MFKFPHRGRFAPSPTGPLHAGSLLAAFGSWLLARQVGGEWLVRIEDVDPPREIAGVAQHQLETLAAFGLHSDTEVVLQSQRSAFYQQALEQLLATGKAFECHCSRSALAATGGIHRRCVSSHPRPDPAVRLHVPDGCVVQFHDAVHGHVLQHVDTAVGDFVLRRSDGLWAYQLAVVVDDALQGITHVVRGADLLDSTPRQIFLQQALGLPTPRYTHLPLVLDGTGKKLSKSSAALPVDITHPHAVLRQLWPLLGQLSLPHTASLSAFLESAVLHFQPETIPTQAHTICAAHNTNITTHA